MLRLGFKAVDTLIYEVCDAKNQANNNITPLFVITTAEDLQILMRANKCLTSFFKQIE